MKANTIAAQLVLVATVLAIGQEVTPRSSGGISGVVRYPDGTPSEGATVSAVTECNEGAHVSLVQEVKTATDGSFYLSPFPGSGCSRIRLSAKKVENLWLKTGRDVFYEGAKSFQYSNYGS